MSCFTTHCCGSCWVGWKRIWFYVPLFYWLHVPVLWLVVAASKGQWVSLSNQPWCTMWVRKTRYHRCVYWAWGSCEQKRTCMSHAWVVTRTRTAAVFAVWPDPAVNSAALAIHTYRLPDAFPVVSLNAWGRETPRNAQSQREIQYARSHPEWQHGGRGRGNTISPSGRAGGEGGWQWYWGAGGDRGKGYKLGSSWFGSASKTTNIKYSCNMWVTIMGFQPYFSSLEILSPLIYFVSTQVKILFRCDHQHKNKSEKLVFTRSYQGLCIKNNRYK